MSKQSKSNVHVNRMHKIQTGFNMYHKYLKHTLRKKWLGKCYRDLQIYSLPFHKKNGNYYNIIVKVIR